LLIGFCNFFEQDLEQANCLFHAASANTDFTFPVSSLFTQGANFFPQQAHSLDAEKTLSDIQFPRCFPAKGCKEWMISGAFSSGSIIKLQ
jgi:hypothetical protein